MNEITNVILMSGFTRTKERAGCWIALLERREEGLSVKDISFVVKISLRCGARRGGEEDQSASPSAYTPPPVFFALRWDRRSSKSPKFNSSLIAIADQSIFYVGLNDLPLNSDTMSCARLGTLSILEIDRLLSCPTSNALISSYPPLIFAFRLHVASS